MTQSKDIWRKIVVLAVVGGLTFWAISIATSLVPITADYRVARWSAEMVWVGSLPAGMIIGFFVSFFLFRFFEKIPTKNPILKALILSVIALIIGTILLEAPTSFGTSDPLYYFLFGTMLNVPRFVFVGIVIGYLYKRLNRQKVAL
jgi:glycopeptide antibiotics resistance protein